MNSKQKAEQLLNLMIPFCKSRVHAKAAVVIACNEILKTKNYTATLHPDLTAFSNAYWNHVIDDLKNLPD